MSYWDITPPRAMVVKVGDNYSVRTYMCGMKFRPTDLEALDLETDLIVENTTEELAQHACALIQAALTKKNPIGKKGKKKR